MKIKYAFSCDIYSQKPNKYELENLNITRGCPKKLYTEIKNI